jgi:hypothetical protein
VAFKTPEEAAKSLGNTISAERLVELADAGYAPHYLIDGKKKFAPPCSNPDRGS